MFISILIFVIFAAFALFIIKANEVTKPRPSSKIKDPVYKKEEVPNKPEEKKIIIDTQPKNEVIINEINAKYNFDLWKNKTIELLDNSYSLSDLLILKGFNEIYYGDLLNCFEWKFKRIEILIRDKYICQNCKTKSNTLHIHHKYYIKDKLPWIIENEALISLCYNCHKKIHEKSEIPVYEVILNEKKLINREKHFCDRCGGTGYLPHFKHVEGGVCFKCRGNLIDKSVYYNILKFHNEKLNFYNDTKRRSNYRIFINDLSNYLLFNTLPDPYNYKVNSFFENKYHSDDDDLPF